MGKKHFVDLIKLMVNVVAKMKAQAAMNTVVVTTATAQQAVEMVATGYHMGST